MILRVGLTGGLGSGKSTVARRLSELGVPILDADLVVRDLYRPGGAGAAAIADEFGAGFLDASGAVDRPAVARLAFSDPAAVARLNARIHPLVHAAQAEWFRELEARGEPLGVVEATLLVEAGGRERYDTIVAVSAPAEQRIARALARDPWTDRGAIERRIAAQMRDEERERFADVVLRNGGAVEDLLFQADTLAGRLRSLAAESAARARSPSES